MKRHEAMEKRRQRSSDSAIWSVLGGIVLVAAAAVVIVSIPDIKRYIKISTM